jgi:putative endonuclease
MNKANTGKIGELETARYLRKNGYEIVAANFRSRYGEIDIIAKNKKYICFVEVKTRAPGQLFSPRDAVTVSKRKKIISTANIFLSQNETRLQPRFDIAEVTALDGRVMDINLIENAFDGEAR